ncbi:hypothetical protein NDN08_001980 [Rhodosorus marinus]|uniref:D-isomer specific 2-hydroxyacid dehydrogenase NAD-binding domain-containing protein n=1 Tax=Rhodosorus marinus TaxID=101924 RepID=A0AAV8UV76_9RHOD|nr:hypothetical protein NDN08_001980 [Rhodosorus marinus]
MGTHAAGLSILVLGEKNDTSLEPLKQLPNGASIIAVENNPDSIEDSVLERATCVYASCKGKAGANLPKIYSKMPNLSWVHSQTAGVDTIVFPEFANDEKVTLTNAKSVYNKSLVEYVIFAMMYFAKDCQRLLRNQRSRTWDPFFIEMIRHKTLGVVGYGDIGRDCARTAKQAFNMKIVALRRRPSLSAGDGIADEVYGSDQLHEMLGKCDYVLCAAPLTPATMHFFNADAFKAMKKSTVFLNIGRGPVCQETALVDALASGAIRGAALDVFEEEPLSKESKLWEQENLLLSPHNADLTELCRVEATEHFLELIQKSVAGEPLGDVIVDKKAGY